MRWLVCLSILATPAAAEPIAVVASFPILADMVHEVGGDRVTVRSLVPPGGDVHVYEPTPKDAAEVAEADLVVVNGLGFEGWMDRLVEAAGAKRVAVASEGVTPAAAGETQYELAAEHGDTQYEHAHNEEAGRAHNEEAGYAHDEEADHAHNEEAGDAHNEEAGHAHNEEEDHAHGDYDPHAWQDVGNARRYVMAIAQALTAADPDGAAAYAANAARYDDELEALDAELKGELALVGGKRALTSHDAFGYFGRAYGVEFVGVQGLSTETEPSARQVAVLIRAMKGEGIDAIFVEALADRRIVDQIAAETGATVGEPLFADTLSPSDGPAPTYVAMMRHNAAALTRALSGANP